MPDNTPAFAVFDEQVTQEGLGLFGWLVIKQLVIESLRTPENGVPYVIAGTKVWTLRHPGVPSLAIPPLYYAYTISSAFPRDETTEIITPITGGNARDIFDEAPLSVLFSESDALPEFAIAPPEGLYRAVSRALAEIHRRTSGR